MWKVRNSNPVSFPSQAVEEDVSAVEMANYREEAKNELAERRREEAEKEVAEERREEADKGLQENLYINSTELGTVYETMMTQREINLKVKVILC